ncbi:Thioredoxin [Seminavis robusta]|uniref:Thioredoxin n=1 Tax=Seminavis robusta TaxID=568900 RepID=A0A9N8D8X3_9STRA|nr:Thioredoxin [Seminavis robusta]|eukprot:Sro19_g013360.1 Thioredoxin (252) ;mRNA; r:46596-47351
MAPQHHQSSVQGCTPLIMNRYLMNFLLVAAAYLTQANAFVPSSPSLSRSTGVDNRHQRQPLFVVADPPNREEEKEKLNGDENDDDKAWVKTTSGGFLPRIPRVLKEKIGRRVIPQEVLTIQEYKAAVADESDCMVCVRFYAPWCKACKAVQQPFRKLCRDYEGVVKFVEVPLTKENAFLHDGLGVPSLPYGHIYHPAAGLVEERKIKKKEFAEFAQVLKTYVQGECIVEYPEDGSACRQATKKEASSEHRP